MTRQYYIECQRKRCKVYDVLEVGSVFGRKKVYLSCWSRVIKLFLAQNSVTSFCSTIQPQYELNNLHMCSAVIYILKWFHFRGASFLLLLLTFQLKKKIHCWMAYTRASLRIITEMSQHFSTSFFVNKLENNNNKKRNSISQRVDFQDELSKSGKHTEMEQTDIFKTRFLYCMPTQYDIYLLQVKINFWKTIHSVASLKRVPNCFSLYLLKYSPYREILLGKL